MARGHEIRSDIDSRYLLHGKNSFDQLQTENSLSFTLHEEFGMFMGIF